MQGLDSFNLVVSGGLPIRYCSFFVVVYFLVALGLNCYTKGLLFRCGEHI